MVAEIHASWKVASSSDNPQLEATKQACKKNIERKPCASLNMFVTPISRNLGHCNAKMGWMATGKKTEFILQL
jgi:hypothetical protein